MFKKILIISIIVIFTFICKNEVQAKHYGDITNMTVTANTGISGEVGMIYSLNIAFDSSLNESVNTIKIPMLNKNFNCTYYTNNIKSVEKNDKEIIINLAALYKAGDKVTVAFQVYYNKFFRINKGEAIYKFKFNKIPGFNVKNAELRWQIANCIYSNYTKQDQMYRYWDLGKLGLFSKEVFVKYDAKSAGFNEANARRSNITDLLSGGGYLIVIFFIVLVCAIIPNDSYRKNSGFGFSGSTRKFRTTKLIQNRVKYN